MAWQLEGLTMGKESDAFFKPDETDAIVAEVVGKRRKITEEGTGHALAIEPDFGPKLVEDCVKIFCDAVDSPDAKIIIS